ncbi:MAG TPA: cobalt-precorrin-5B (C(1))-methyltransferase [Pseudonocardia sp.]|nr:cobalt-precorrin-5B (C(1))-methyltransferase [Pseudonocardia sp.]
MTEPPDLREPDLPRTAKVRPRALRTGFSTGANAAAAAKAAAMLLRDGTAPASVEIPFPSGERHSFAPHTSAHHGDSATAVVVKDAGDDPDVTHGAHLTATVRLGDDPAGEVVIGGGEGVGTVTKPGLGLPVGGPAINPVPRRMITEAVREVVPAGAVLVTISVPGGERMARRTTNRRLGIEGGISILGTTGIVRPFSTASWRASVEQAVSVMAAQGCPTLVLATGGRTERGAMALLPALPEVAFVEVGDFTGAALRRAVEHGLRDVVFVGMVGKLTKLASGVLMTHYTRSAVDTGLLAGITGRAGGSDELVAQVGAANTARHAYELWEAAGLLRPCGDALCAAVRDVLQRFSAEAGRELPARVAMVDFTGTGVVASTEPEWVPG